jgi:hypothetical protein
MWIRFLHDVAVWGVFAIFALAVAVALLKVACSVAGAEIPDTSRAVVTSLLEAVVGAVARLAVILHSGYAGSVGDLPRQNLEMMAAVVLFALAFVIPVGIYMPMLRVSFGKGLVIVVVRYALTIAAYAVIGFVVTSVLGRNVLPRII